jgi:hypothetical protein
MKLMNEAGATALLRQIDIKRVVIQLEERMQVHDVSITQHLSRFFLMRLPIGATNKRSVSIGIRVQYDQMRFNCGMLIQSTDDPNRTSRQRSKSEMNNKHNCLPKLVSLAAAE